MKFGECLLPFISSVRTYYNFTCWSLTLREEPTLKVSENRVVKRIFVSKRREEAGV
jgi:hypothetical protein